MAAPLAVAVWRHMTSKVAIDSLSRCALCLRRVASKTGRVRAPGHGKRSDEWVPGAEDFGSVPVSTRGSPKLQSMSGVIRTMPASSAKGATGARSSTPALKHAGTRGSGTLGLEQTENRRSSAPRQGASRPVAAASSSPTESKSNVNVGSEVIEYEFLEDNNKKIGAAFLAAKSRKEREKNGIILLEGHRLVKEAFTAGVKLQELFFAGSAAEVLQEFQPAWLRGQPIYKVRYQCLKTWSDVSTPQGVCGFFQMPENGADVIKGGPPVPLTVVCDNIREPGNMGAIIRSAAAAGCERLVTTKGCVSVWEPKVIRAAAGGHFHVPLFHDQSWEQVNAIVTSNYTVYLASSSASSDHQASSRLSSRRARDLLLEGADDADTVPDQPGEEGKYGEPKPGRPRGGYKRDDDDDQDDDTEADVEKYRFAPLVTSSYCDVSYAAGSGKHVALVIGGETHGLSAHAHKLAFDRYGCRVHVPTAPNVDSLNSAVAAGVLLFEVKRQLAATLKA